MAENSIKVSLYNLIKERLESLINSDNSKVFKYVGHYNGQDLENPNKFSFATPAVFIELRRVDWVHTKHRTTDSNLYIEQDGIIIVAIHYFIHDLRTDTDSYIQHLNLIDTFYRALIGLRSIETEYGKVSSLRRISEVDDINNNNLRHWVTEYETRVQETASNLGLSDAQPITININDYVQPRPDEEFNLLINNDDNNVLLINDNDNLITEGYE